MVVRNYKPSDCEILAELFYQTVHAVNARDYTEEQLNAWASGTVDLQAWNRSLSEHYTVVVEEENVNCNNENRIVGFGDVDESGYLDRLFVHKDYQRQGIATIICEKLEHGYPRKVAEHAVDVDRITTHASITARPFFAKRGYQVIKEQQVIRDGISLTNYVMEKRVSDMEIRFAEIADIGMLARHDHHVSREEMKNLILQNRIYIAEENGEFVGWLRYNLFWDNTPFLNLLYVMEAHRGKGFGRQLVTFWESEMECRGYKMIMTSTQADEYAQHFYFKLGYEAIGGFRLGDAPYEILFSKRKTKREREVC